MPRRCLLLLLALPGMAQGQPLTSCTRTEPIRRDGRFLHLILALRAPF